MDESPNQISLLSTTYRDLSTNEVPIVIKMTQKLFLNSKQKTPSNSKRLKDEKENSEKVSLLLPLNFHNCAILLKDEGRNHSHIQVVSMECPVYFFFKVRLCCIQQKETLLAITILYQTSVLAISHILKQTNQTFQHPSHFITHRISVRQGGKYCSQVAD